MCGLPLKRVESTGARAHESEGTGAHVAGFGVRKLCLRFVSECCRKNKKRDDCYHGKDLATNSTHFRVNSWNSWPAVMPRLSELNGFWLAASYHFKERPCGLFGVSFKFGGVFQVFSGTLIAGF